MVNLKDISLCIFYPVVIIKILSCVSYVMYLTELFLLINLLRMLVARTLVITTEPVKRDLPAKATAVYVHLDSWVKYVNLVRNVYHIISI